MCKRGGSAEISGERMGGENIWQRIRLGNEIIEGKY